MSNILRQSISVKIAAVIILFVCILSSVQYLLDVKQIRANFFDDKITETHRTITVLQSQLHYVMALGDLNQSRKIVTELGGIKNLQYGWLLDEQNRVVAATRTVHIGKPFDSVVKPEVYQRLQPHFKSVKNVFKPDIWLSVDKQSIYAAAPVTLGRSSKHSVRSDKTGIVYLQIDMSWVDKQTGYLLQQSLLPVVLLTFVVALIIVLYFHRLIARRLNILNEAALGLVASNLTRSVEVYGNDEIAKLAGAFNTMTTQVREQYKRLSEQKQALHDQESEHRQILDFMADGIVTIDQSGCIRSFNKSAEVLFGYSQDEIIGQKVNQLMPADHAAKHDEYIDRYVETSVPKIIGSGREVLGLRKDNSTFILRLSVVELPNCKDGTRHFIGSCVDLTETKQHEEQLRRSQKMDALGKLTGGIAHDFNNILGVIMGYSQLLCERLVEQPLLVKYAKQVNHAGERGAKLTKKLLSFSKSKPDQQMSADINQLINEEADMLRKSLTARVELQLNLADQLWPVMLNEGAFEDMLLNMSINGMHAISGNGTLTITTANQSLSFITADRLAIEVGDYVSVTIQDNGCGMSEDIRSKIFDPFFSTKGVEGTGLGLSQVYGFIGSSKGAIEVYSTVGEGTRFVLYFPRDLVLTAGQAPDEGLALEDTRGDETILVVDDEQALCALAESILSARGYKVFTASNAQEALFRLASDKVDLMLSDIIMPHTNGYQLSKLVRQQYPDVKIRLSSGFEGHIDTPDNRLSLDEPVICKPYTPRQLLSAIRVQLNKKPKASTPSSSPPPPPPPPSSASVSKGPLAEAALNKSVDVIQWTNRMCIDNGEIDEDHKQLLSMLNSCWQLEADDGFVEPLKVLLQQLGDYTRDHFAREEAVMKACDYPHYDNHRAVHKMMLAKFESMVNTQSDEQVRQWIGVFLTDWLIEHIMVMDKVLVDYIEAAEPQVREALDAAK